VAVIYFSPRLLCRFDLALRAISIRRRLPMSQWGLLLGRATSPQLPPFSLDKLDACRLLQNWEAFCVDDATP
jgi:hypothetical protein